MEQPSRPSGAARSTRSAARRASPRNRCSPRSDPAVAIETVDFGAREGTIFLMQEGEGSTPVVWLMDEPAPLAVGWSPV